MYCLLSANTFHVRWVEASVHDHEDILQSFREADPEKARGAMHQHMLNAGDLLARSFNKEADANE